MNTAEVIESDKLIAEFMEYETVLVPVSSYNGRGGVNISIVDGYHIPKHSWKNEVLSCKGTYDWSSSNLQFSFNWDWLMPVVERIESLKITLEVYKICKVRVAIVETKCNIDLVVLPAVESIAGLQTTPIIPMSFCSRNESKIKATYTAVIDFIKWYKKNAPATIHKYPMSLGFHAHHCNLSLSVVKGTLVNWIVKPVKSVSDLQDYVTAHLFEYKSAIKTGSMDINLDKANQFLLTEAVQILNPGDMVMMEASAIHTVSCTTDEVTAWIVFEGKEDDSYKPQLWSNWDITEQDYSKLYRKIELMKLIQLLQLADLMAEV